MRPHTNASDITTGLPTPWSCGFGFAWVCGWFVLWSLKDIVRGSVLQDSTTELQLMHQAGLIVTFALVGICSRRIVTIAGKKRPLLLTGLASAAALAVFCQKATWLATPGLFCISLLVIAVAVGVLSIGWSELFAVMGTRRTSLSIALSILIAGITAIAIRLFWDSSHSLAALLVSCMPLCSSICLIKTRATLGPRSNERDICNRPFSMPPLIIAYLIVYPLAFSLGFNLLATTGTPSSLFSPYTLGQIVGIIVAAGLHVAITIAQGSRFDLARTYQPVLALSVLSVVSPLLAQQAPLAVVGICSIMGYAYSNMFEMMVYAELSDRAPASALRVNGIGATINTVFLTLGMIFPAPARLIIHDVQTPLIASVLVILVTLGTSVLNPNNIARLWGAEEPNPRNGADMTLAMAELCRKTTQANGLTRRQEEVLNLLVQGMTLEQMQDELTLSYDTVRSHIKAVYAKVGVHSRTELMRAVLEIDAAPAE